MSTLLIRLAGPLQSWGYRSRFIDRDTGLEPTKSGVVGLLCCALGQSRAQSPTKLASLAMHVRVDRQGTLLEDFHTAGGGIFRSSKEYYAPKSSGGKGENPVITHRHYLQDASFLVALEGDHQLLTTLAAKLSDPAWPLALGRRSCPPAEPVLESHSPLEQDAFTSLLHYPLKLHPQHLPERWNPQSEQFEPDLSPQKIRFVRECPSRESAHSVRQDVPVAWNDSLSRQYSTRFVREEIVSMTPEVAL